MDSQTGVYAHTPLNFNENIRVKLWWHRGASESSKGSHYEGSCEGLFAPKFGQKVLCVVGEIENRWNSEFAQEYIWITEKIGTRL